MDDDGGLGIRNWNYYDNHQPLKGNLGLRLMSTVATDHESKPSVMVSAASSNGAFLHQPHYTHHFHHSHQQNHNNHHPHQQNHNHHHPRQPSVPMDFVRESWMNHRDQNHLHHQPAAPISSSASNNKVPHALPVSYSVLSDVGHDGGGHHTLQMLHPPDQPQPHHPNSIPKVERLDEEMDKSSPDAYKDAPLKKRSHKSPKPKRVKRTPDEGAPPRPRPPGGKRKNSGGSSSVIGTGVVINGIDLDISGIPTPVCSCTGVPQQCYRWGIGGWQSACCTTSMSVYPLPMSTKRRGARIAGRKMSQGAFKKVLEKLASEGQNLSNPIDLKMHWAKHGTNKFVTIR
ncbi:Protein Barley B recombinant [Acorus gramineus]|uniref:GAGA-binding transcriptional activator n=1 Tax=Acorus gramineus TaxID=55184 RepID=A0AAV9AIZ7_ACOGR|nr:Protein Barley B recombinant [Acorus gramineus]